MAAARPSVADRPELPPCPCDGCTLEVDIAIQSSDKGMLGAHSRNIELYSPVLFGLRLEFERRVHGLTIWIAPESADVLMLLLWYLHADRKQPRLDILPFDKLAAFAYAAERYSIYSAMEVCRMCMRRFVSKHPLGVLAYALEHGYRDLVDEAAPLTVCMGLGEVEKALSLVPEAFTCWVKYREPLVEGLNRATHPPVLYVKDGVSVSHGGCDLWKPFAAEVFSALGEGHHVFESLRSFGRFVGRNSDHLLHDCDECQLRASEWARKVEQCVTMNLLSRIFFQ